MVMVIVRDKMRMLQRGEEIPTRAKNGPAGKGSKGEGKESERMLTFVIAKSSKPGPYLAPRRLCRAYTLVPLMLPAVQ